MVRRLPRWWRSFDRSARRSSGLRLGLMHGRLPSDEKDAVMAAFRAGQIDVLVCRPP